MLLTAGARLLQYGGSAVLCGTPLFFLYGLRSVAVGPAGTAGWPRWGFVLAALAVLIGGAASLSIETAAMTDQSGDAFRPAALWEVLSGSRFGGAIGARLGLAGLALGAALAPAGRSPTIRARNAGLALLGAGDLVSFAWTGHGAMDDGWAGLLHLGADLVHLLAAGVWVGALAALTALAVAARSRSDPAAVLSLHDGLHRFSGVGALMVALLILTGLVNSWFLIGPDHLGGLIKSPYGAVLIAKLLLFAAMLLLAVQNRYRLTPALAPGLSGGRPERALRGLVFSLGLETAAAAGVLALVGALGALSPLSMPM